MKLSEILTADRIRIPLAARSKGDAIEELISLLGKSRPEADAILEAVLDRERRMTTGIGRGVAIPHARSEHALGLEAAFGLTSPLDWNALDRQPVRAVFLLVAKPDQPEPQLRALAGISRMMASDHVQEELLAATEAEEIRSLLAREESEGNS